MVDRPPDLGRRPLLDSLTPRGGFSSDGRIPLRANPDPFFQTEFGSGIALNTAAIEIIIDGGGAVITTGVKGDIEVPFKCTMVKWVLLADQSGSIKVDVFYDSFNNFPPH